MFPKKLSDVKENEFDDFTAGEYDKKIIELSDDNNALPTKNEGKSKAYEIVQKLENSMTMRTVLQDLLFNPQQQIDILSSSVYPDSTEDFYKYIANRSNAALNKRNEDLDDKAMYSFMDEKRFLLLTYKAFQIKSNRITKNIHNHNHTEKQNMKNDDYEYLEKMLENIYKYGTEINRKVDKIFRNEITEAFKDVDKDNAVVFTTGIKEESKYQAYTYNEIMGGKSKKKVHLKDFSDEEKTFLAKRFSPYDIESMQKYFESGYKALVDLDISAKYFTPKQEDIDTNRFLWIPENEGTDYYEVNQNSIIREKIRGYLDDSNFTTYTDNRKFNMLALYRTLEYMKIISPKANYEPKELINFTEKLMKNIDEANKDDKLKKEPLYVFSKLNKNDHLKVIEMNYESLSDYYKEYIPEYVEKVIYNNPRNFEDIINNTNYKFSTNELKHYIMLVPDRQERLLYNYYKKGNLTEKELLDIIKSDSDLSSDELIYAILKDDDKNTNRKIQNLQKILKEQKATPDNIAGFLKGNFLYGKLTADEINDIRDNILSKIPNMDTSRMRANPEIIANQFMAVNKDKILGILKDEEGFTESDFKELYKDFPILAADINKEYMDKLTEDYIYNKALYISSDLKNNEKAAYTLETKLDTLMCSAGILKLLYDEKLISKEKGMALGGKDFLDKIEKSEYNKVFDNEKDDKSNKTLSVEEKKAESKNLEELFKKTIKKSKKYSKYNVEEFINRYNEFESKLSDEEKTKFEEKFSEYQNDLLANSNKLYKESIISLGKNGILTKESLYEITKKENYMDVIGKLITEENAIGIDTLKYIFNDDIRQEQNSGRYEKRNLLEKLFNTNNLSEDEKFSILTSVYGFHEDTSDKQKETDNDNFQYFIDKGYLTIDDISDRQNSDSESYENKTTRSGNTIKSEQQKYPFLDRNDAYYTIDKDVSFTRTLNAWIYLSHKFDKVAIETIGTKKNGKIQNDLTNHATYTMSVKTFEDMKDVFIEKDSKNRKAINFSEVFSYYRLNKDGKNMGRICHTKHWKERIKEEFTEKQKDILDKENTNKDKEQIQK